MKNNLLISLIVLALIGGAVYFSLNKSQTATTTPEATSVSPTSAEASPTGEAMMEEVTEIVVEGKAFEFTPDTITVKKGEKTRIVFKNTGGMHDFNVDELGMKTKIINTGEEDSVEFTATEAGTYEFYCSVANHRQMGMKGTLIVE